MANPIRFGSLAGTAIAAVMLSACSNDASNATASAPVAESDCVVIAEGNYLFEDGKFVATTKPAPTIVERVIEKPVGWKATVGNSFAGLGYPWMGLQVTDQVATLTGLAPDRASKERALEAGKAAIDADPEGSKIVSLVVDGIAVEGEEDALGDALVELSQNVQTVETCQAAFNKTLGGRSVVFQSNRAVISQVSAGLLGAVTGVAMLCNEHDIEIQGHTDARGSDNHNMKLSQLRADAVREHLIDLGVDGAGLVAVGYGEARLLDTSGTPSAAAKNRRIEFKVKPKAVPVSAE